MTIEWIIVVIFCIFIERNEAVPALGFNNGSHVHVNDSNSLDLSTSGSIVVCIKINLFQINGGIVHKGDLSNFTDESYSLQLGGLCIIFCSFLMVFQRSYQIQSFKKIFVITSWVYGTQQVCVFLSMEH